MGFRLTDPAGCLYCIFFICQYSSSRQYLGGIMLVRYSSVETRTIEPSAGVRAPMMGPCSETLGAASPN